jgi:hypothetical protein
MKNGMVIVDADAHVVDLDEIYRQRLPEGFRRRMSIYPSDGFDRLQNGALLWKRPKDVRQNFADNDGVPVSFHASGSDTLHLLSHFDNFLAIHTLSHGPEQLIACTAVVYSGLLEAFQDLRVAFLEAGCGWVPFWMERMDEEWKKRKFDAPLLEARPS